MTGHPLIYCRTNYNLGTTFEVLTTPYQGYASSIASATLRLAVFHVNTGKRVEWRPLANDRKCGKSPGYERQRRFFTTNIYMPVRYRPTERSFELQWRRLPGRDCRRRNNLRGTTVQRVSVPSSF